MCLQFLYPLCFVSLCNIKTVCIKNYKNFAFYLLIYIHGFLLYLKKTYDSVGYVYLYWENKEK